MFDVTVETHITSTANIWCLWPEVGQIAHSSVSISIECSLTVIVLFQATCVLRIFNSHKCLPDLMHLDCLDLMLPVYSEEFYFNFEYQRYDSTSHSNASALRALHRYMKILAH